MNHLRIFLSIFALIHSADTSGYETGSAYPEDVSSDPASGHFEYANTNNAQQQTGQQGGMTIGDFHRKLTARLSVANTSANNNRATMLPSSPTGEYSHPTMAAATQQQKLSYAIAQNMREFHKTLTAGLTNNNETKRMTKIMPSSPTTGVMSPYESIGTVGSGGETAAAQFAQPTSSFGRTRGGGTGGHGQPTLRTLSLGGAAAGGTQQNIPSNTGTTGRDAELAMLTGIFSGQSSTATGATMPRPSTFTHGRATDGVVGGSGRPTLQSLSSGTQSAAGQSPTFTSGTQPHPTYIGTHSINFGNTRRQAEIAMLADALSGLTSAGGAQPTNVGSASHSTATGPRPSSSIATQQQQTLLPSSTIPQTSAGPSIFTRTLTPIGGSGGHPQLRTLSTAGIQSHPTYVRPNTSGIQPTNVGSASHPTSSRTPSSLPTQHQQQTVVLPPSTMSHTSAPSTGTLTSPHVRLTRPRTSSRLPPLGSGVLILTQQRPPTAQNPTAPHPMMTSISTASHQSQSHQAAAATQHLPTLSRPSQSQQRPQSSGHHRQTFQPISHPTAVGTGETGTSSAAHQSAGGFARPTSSNEMQRSVSAPHQVGPSTAAGSSLATAPRISAGIRSASTGSSSAGNPPISALSDSERIRQRTKGTFASGAPLLNAYHINLNQYGAPQRRTKKLLESLSNLQGDAYSVSEASQKILHYGNDAHYELLQYQGQLDREKSEGKLNEQEYNERLQTAKDAMKYLTKLREASAEYKTLRKNRPANE